MEYLPGEIVGAIADYLNLDDLNSLTSTGNRLLRHKVWSFKSFISESKVSHGDEVSPWDKMKNIKLWPKNVKEAVLYEYKEVPVSVQKLHIFEIRKPVDFDCKYLMNLTSLKVENTPIVFLRHLSRSLTELDCCASTVFENTLSELPRNLVNLKLNVLHDTPIKSSWLSQLPRELEELELNHAIEMEAEPDFCLLPMWLKKLELYVPRLDKDMVRYLPTGLKWLQLYCSTKFDLSILDSLGGLEYLGGLGIVKSDTKEFLKKLPNLKKLDFIGFDNVDELVEFTNKVDVLYDPECDLNGYWEIDRIPAKYRKFTSEEVYNYFWKDRGITCTQIMNLAHQTWGKPNTYDMDRLIPSLIATDNKFRLCLGELVSKYHSRDKWYSGAISKFYSFANAMLN